MKRRGFLGWLIGGVVGLVEVAGMLRAGPQPRGRAFDMDSRFEEADLRVATAEPWACLAQPYRLGADGRWRRCGHLDLKPGDRVLVLGMDGDELWNVTLGVVGDCGAWVEESGQPVAAVRWQRPILKDAADPDEGTAGRQEGGRHAG